MEERESAWLVDRLRILWSTADLLRMLDLDFIFIFPMNIFIIIYIKSVPNGLFSFHLYSSLAYFYYLIQYSCMIILFKLIF